MIFAAVRIERLETGLRHFVEKRFGERHFVERHFVERHFVDAIYEYGRMREEICNPEIPESTVSLSDTGHLRRHVGSTIVMSGATK